MYDHSPISIPLSALHKRQILKIDIDIERDIFIHSYSVLQTLRACYIMVNDSTNLGQIMSLGTLTHMYSKNL